MSELLSWRYVGHAFELKLPDSLHVHSIFSPEKLRLVASTEPLLGQLQDEGPKLKVNGHRITNPVEEALLLSKLARSRPQSKVVSSELSEERATSIKGLP
ncbi:hypothetical protein DPV78_009732 [Talaromyces pinophilus]|nr:hypothetical protein DPV78_009732 [Talaromyces pinophilus]